MDIKCFCNPNSILRIFFYEYICGTLSRDCYSDPQLVLKDLYLTVLDAGFKLGHEVLAV